MHAVKDLDLYERGIRTAVACWTAYARTIAGGAVHRLPGADVAVFTDGPERDVFNNAVLGHGLAAPERRATVNAMTATYAAAGVTAYAAWVHESDDAMLAELAARGFTHEETTWAMGRAVDPAPARDARVTPAEWDVYTRVLDLPPGLLQDADPADFHLLVGSVEGDSVATGMAYDHDGDCGIFNVVTRERARRRGLGSAVVAGLLADAADRGCRTSTLQSTEMARRVYVAQGFRDLGRILELSPPGTGN
jgi:ribosomal protein S18 acetylase RimI-like enzyme